MSAALDGFRSRRNRKQPFDEVGEPFSFCFLDHVDRPGTPSTQAKTGAVGWGSEFLNRPFRALGSRKFRSRSDQFPSPSGFARTPRPTRNPPGETANAPANIRVRLLGTRRVGPRNWPATWREKNLVRVVRPFDVIAIQQISSLQRDSFPHGRRRSTRAPLGGGTVVRLRARTAHRARRREANQMVILFPLPPEFVSIEPKPRVADPTIKLTYDPLVAWFRSAAPRGRRALDVSASSTCESIFRGASTGRRLC